MDNQFDKEFKTEGLYAEKTERKIPIAWLALFFGLLIYGGIYIALFTPAFSGWTSEGEMMEEFAEAEGPRSEGIENENIEGNLPTE